GHALSYGSLLGARGNSGVILSQVLKGFADSIKGLTSLTAQGVADALVSDSADAYAAGMKPVECPNLKIVSESAEVANNAARSSANQVTGPVAVLQIALEAGRETLARTPDMLPILKQAGVVDAGGLGYLRLLEGLIAYFEARDLPSPPK